MLIFHIDSDFYLFFLENPYSLLLNVFGTVRMVSACHNPIFVMDVLHCNKYN